MIPAISNIAWPAACRDAAYAAMAARGVRGLEIAPALFLAGADDPFDPDPDVLAAAEAALAAHGLELVSMQSLTFGANDIAMFGDEAERAGFEAALERAIGLAGRLKTPAMVFGSPKHRVIPDGMTSAEASGIAVATLTRLAGFAAAAGTRLGLEVNPAAYGTNFMTDFDATMDVVERVAHPAIGLNLDMGALIMNGDVARLGQVLDRAQPHLVHVHVSEPHLAPAPADPATLARLVEGLAARSYAGAISVEMRPAGDDPVVGVGVALDRLVAALDRRGYS